MLIRSWLIRPTTWSSRLGPYPGEHPGIGVKEGVEVRVVVYVGVIEGMLVEVRVEEGVDVREFVGVAEGGLV